MDENQSFLTGLRESDTHGKIQFLDYLLHGIKSGSIRLSEQEKQDYMTYALGEVSGLTSAILSEKRYREKDELMQYEGLLLETLTILFPDPKRVPEDDLERIHTLVTVVKNERYLENEIVALFEEKSIQEEQVERLLDTVRGCTDEYQRSKFLSGLIYYEKEHSRLTDDARRAIAAYVEEECRRCLAVENKSDDCLGALELIADLFRSFETDATKSLLTEILALNDRKIDYYAVETLLIREENLPDEVLVRLAEDPVYADTLHKLLSRHGKVDRFPSEYSDPLYLAKSDLIQWLNYPTELGCIPDEIEYVGKISYLFGKEVFQIFKYRSASENLNEELRNRWLIGWSSNRDGTFSNFDPYDEYEKETVEKTLKNIKRKLIGR